MDDIFMTSKLRWLKKKVGSEWEDIVQTARVKCLGQSAQPYYSAYLTRAVSNTAINFLKQKTMVSLDEREERSNHAVEHSYEINFGAIHDLREFMLPRWTAKERDVIFMFFTDQITIRVAAEMVKRSRTNTHNWLRAVKREIRKGLAAYAY